MVMKSVKYHLSKHGLKLPRLLGRAIQSFKHTNSSGNVRPFFFIAGKCLDDLKEDFGRLRKSFLQLSSFLPVLAGDECVFQRSEHLLEVIRHQVL